MPKRFRLIAPTVTFVVIAGILFAQKNPQNELSGTLEKLQHQLQELQTQARTLQESLRQIARNAGSTKTAKQSALMVTSPGAGPDAPADNVTSAEEQKAANFQKAQNAYSKGAELEEQKLYRAAIEAFSETIHLDPANDSAYLHRGYGYSQLGDNVNAASDLTKSLTLQPNNSRAYLARATAYATLGQDPLALADLNEAMVRDPNNADGLVLRGRMYQLGGDHQKAATDYTVALSINPEAETAYLGRAVSLRGQGLMPLALADCDNAVRVNPNSPAGYLCRAESFTRTGATPQAIEQLNQAILATQTLRQPLTRLNDLIQTVAGSLPRGPAVPPVTSGIAPPVNQPVIQTTPAPAPATTTAQNSQIGPITINIPAPLSSPPATKPTDLAATLRSATGNSAPSSSGREDAGYYARLGRVRLDQMSFAEAIKAFDQAVKYDASLATVYNARGYAHLRILNYAQATADFSEAIRLNPAYINAYLNRSVSRKLGGDAVGANQDKAKLLEILRGSQVASVPTRQ